jgi:hypothetical protein
MMFDLMSIIHFARSKLPLKFLIGRKRKETTIFFVHLLLILKNRKLLKYETFNKIFYIYVHNKSVTFYTNST